jgi:hypothetical protein
VRGPPITVERAKGAARARKRFGWWGRRAKAMQGEAGSFGKVCNGIFGEGAQTRCAGPAFCVNPY